MIKEKYHDVLFHDSKDDLSEVMVTGSRDKCGRCASHSFHTQNPEWCIQSLLEINNLTQNIFDNNIRLKQVIKKKGNY